MSHRTVVAALAAALIALVSAPAASAAPPGKWTLVHRDHFLHYACKVPTTRKGRFALRTYTSLNGDRNAIRYGIGVWVAVTHGSNRNTLASMERTRWVNDATRFAVRARLPGDARIWMQGAYYGPPEPWSDGTPIRSLATCASPA